MTMDSPELVELINETKKQLLHLRTLGVEGIQLPNSAPGNPKSRVLASTAAVAPVRAEPQKTSQAAKTTSPDDSSLFGDLGPAPEMLAPSNETFEQIHLDIGDCTRCPLHRERTTIVHTEGNRKARLMFVGEAPGADEDIQARPFVGRAGQLL